MSLTTKSPALLPGEKWLAHVCYDCIVTRLFKDESEKEENNASRALPVALPMPSPPKLFRQTATSPLPTICLELNCAKCTAPFQMLSYQKIKRT